MGEGINVMILLFATDFAVLKVWNNYLKEKREKGVKIVIFNW